MSTLDLCEKLFGKRNIYELLDVSKNADIKDIKKGYYKLSLQVHPDRVSEAEKQEATEKFKLLSKVYQVLSDVNKRALYDEQGLIDDDDDDNLDSKLTNWLEVWSKIFKPLTLNDIENYEKSYVGSELERADIKKSYLSSKGCINVMMNEVPFLKVSEEPRLQQIVREMIDAGEVPEYKIFTEEPEAKRKRRHQKHARESKIADKLKAKHIERGKKRAEEDSNVDLAMAIRRRQEQKANSFDTLMDKLVQKYGNNSEEDDVIEFKASGKKGTKKSTKNAKAKKEHNELHGVKKGKVNKKK